MNNPKPCPFCGHSVKVLSYQEKSTNWKIETHVECRTSGCFGANVRFVSEWGEDPEAFIERWNARATAGGGEVSKTRQCEFCDKELPDQAEFDACEPCIKVMTALINDPPVRTIQPEDGWGDCTTCGQPTGSADLWQDTCPRCAKLAALEREIGRAYLELRDGAEIQMSYDGIDYVATYRRNQKEAELENLITRYRALLAAGAEAATGDEDV